MQIFLEAALGRRVDLGCLEDNTQCLGAVKSGYSAALRSTCSGCELIDHDLNIYSDLLDLILNMSILNLDMFVLSFDMFVLIYYQSDLNFDQFDLNFGQIIYSYSGQFVPTATTASSSSPRNFLCRFQLRGDSWGIAIRLVACIFILPGGRSPSSLGHST